MRVALLLLFVPAVAVADDDLDVHGAADEPLQKSHLIPITETVTLEVGLQLASELAGREWVMISPSTMWSNLTGSWEVDEDPFTIDQLGHPYTGAYPFLAARSMGHGFWVSGAYAFVGSLAWELLAETNPPSLNDQITTPIGGALIGESLHRMGRALRAGHPGIVRTGAASLLDPVGAFNRSVFGKAWRDRVPPSYYAHVGVGWERVGGVGEATSDSDELHLELVLEHGLPSDPDLVMRRPFEHFVLRGAVDLSSDQAVGTLDVRGIVIGKRMDHGLYGLYGTYDYMNPDGVRVSAIGVGPGVVGEVAPTESTYLRGTAMAALVPWGAAGGSNEMQGPPIDYHHGPGAAQLLELEFGKVGGSAVRATSRAWEIAGGFVDSGREIIMSHTLAGRWALTGSHALGVESTLMTRSATFGIEPNADTREVEVRVFYALTASQH